MSTKVKKATAAKTAPARKAPAAEGAHVYEITKKQALYVVSVYGPGRSSAPAGMVGMAYREGGTEAVRATWADFGRFFKVIEGGPCAKCKMPVEVGQFCFGCGELICEGCGEAPLGRHDLDDHTEPCSKCGERLEANAAGDMCDQCEEEDE